MVQDFKLTLEAVVPILLRVHHFEHFSCAQCEGGDSLVKNLMLIRQSDLA